MPFDSTHLIIFSFYFYFYLVCNIRHIQHTRRTQTIKHFPYTLSEDGANKVRNCGIGFFGLSIVFTKVEPERENGNETEG